MPTADLRTSMLVVIDMQTRLIAAIDDAASVVANARLLVDAARLLGAPALFTEQNPKGLGPTVMELAPDPSIVVPKMTFDSCRSPEFLLRAPADRAIIIAGCEAHVCVLQTALGLIDRGRRVFVVRDAIGSRRAESKEAAIARMARHNVEIVTAEMVVFEWLGRPNIQASRKPPPWSGSAAA
jgi:nicotinamidase-related amidase